jgi:hypothetical protein
VIGGSKSSLLDEVARLSMSSILEGYPIYSILPGKTRAPASFSGTGTGAGAAGVAAIAVAIRSQSAGV